MKLILKNPSDYGKSYMNDLASRHGLYYYEDSIIAEISGLDNEMFDILKEEIETEVVMMPGENELYYDNDEYDDDYFDDDYCDCY